MKARAVPPADITPEAFFSEWVPERVAGDDDRRRRLAGTRAVIEFALTGDGGGHHSIHIDRGRVRGENRGAEAADLRVSLDVETWRALNAGTLSAPEAFLRRLVHLKGDLRLAVKLHVILG